MAKDDEFWRRLLEAQERVKSSAPEQLKARLADLQQTTETTTEIRPSILAQLAAVDPRAYQEALESAKADAAEVDRLVKVRLAVLREPGDSQ